MPHDPLLDVRRPTLPQSARTLHAVCSHGVLATLDPREGYPYASRAEVLPLEDGDVLFFLSDLAAHTTNQGMDERASVLLSDPWNTDRVLARQRMTLMGTLEREEDREQWKPRWLEAHPDSAGYIDFSDFQFYRLRVERARYIAGFGRMDWLEGAIWRQAEPDPLVGAMGGIIEHMNEDHGYNLLDYARHIARVPWAQQARMLWIDHLGFDIEVLGDSEDSPSTLRMMFSEPCQTSGHVRRELVALANRARELGGADEQE